MSGGHGSSVQLIIALTLLRTDPHNNIIFHILIQNVPSLLALFTRSVGLIIAVRFYFIREDLGFEELR